MQAILPASAGARTGLSASRVRTSIKRCCRGACCKGVCVKRLGAWHKRSTIPDFINTGLQAGVAGCDEQAVLNGFYSAARGITGF